MSGKGGLSSEELKVTSTSWLPSPYGSLYLAFPRRSGAAPVTFVVVVLHGEDPAFGRSGRVKNELPVQGLDGEGVQHTDADLLCEGGPECS